MSDENEDQWLYGDSVDSKDCTDAVDNSVLDGSNPPFNNQEEPPLIHDVQKNVENGNSMGLSEELTPSECEDQSQSNEANNGETSENKNTVKDDASQEDGEAATDSDSDDDVHVVIGDIKSAPSYSTINIKRSGILPTGNVPEKINKQPGKFSIDEFETIGVINGFPAHEFNLDQLEDKPWRQPGADITDYFNYGFNEETWRAYCERQKRLRSESGVGLILNAGGGVGNTGGIGSRIPQVTITNYNSKYSGIMGPKRAGPPPGRKMAGTIDVIGSTGLASRRNLDKSPPKENVIQVMTADRREYSRKPGFPDMSVPPPVAIPPPPTFEMPPPGYPEPAPYFVPEVDSYYASYEPTQDRQWGNNPTWPSANLSIPLTGESDKEPGSKSIPTMVPPVSMPTLVPSRDQREGRERDRDRERDWERDRERDMESMSRSRDRDKDRERDRERDKESMVRDRDREKESVARDEDRDRDRARSQSYRHKERHRHRSRSRSRRHKSRSRSPSRRKKKSRRSERERSKEDSE